MTKRTAAQRKQADQVRDCLELAMDDPWLMLEWMATMDGPVRKGLAGRAKMSPLAYAIRFYLEHHLRLSMPPMPTGIWWTIRQLDDVAVTAVITAPSMLKTDMLYSSPVEVAYADWLFDFFEDDTNLALLDPGCNESLMDTIRRLHDFVAHWE